jgi:ABC-type polysaccharide/polyol phosphate export permease
MSTATVAAREDLITGFLSFRAWRALAVDDLMARYARTVIGPLWMTIAHGFFVFGYAFWSSVILKQDLAVQLPYVAAGLTIWAWISTSLVEGTGVYLRAIPLINAYDLPVSLHVFRAIAGQFFSFCHNMIIFVLAALVVGFLPNANLLWAIPGLALLFLTFVGWSLVLGLLGARYRDVQPLIGSLIGMLFILTPVFWRREDIVGAQWLADFNPFYHLLEIVREPLLGQPPDPINWAVSSVIAIGSLAVGVGSFVIWRARLTYWL